VKNYCTTFVAISALILVLGCSSLGYSIPHYETLADKLTRKTAKKLEAQTGLYLIGTGGQMMDDIQKMMMGFAFYQVIDIEIARSLLVKSVEEYLSDINSNEEIRPYLHNYPFSAENIEIVIYFHSPDGSDVPPGKISIAAANKGKVSYYIDYPEKHTIKPIHEENYQDALRTVSLNAL